MYLFIISAVIKHIHFFLSYTVMLLFKIYYYCFFFFNLDPTKDRILNKSIARDYHIIIIIISNKNKKKKIYIHRYSILNNNTLYIYFEGNIYNIIVIIYIMYQHITYIYIYTIYLLLLYIQ